MTEHQPGEGCAEKTLAHLSGWAFCRLKNSSRYRMEKDILELYPYLEPEDIDESLTYAACRVEEIDVPIHPASV